jgi:hypothetical protein
MKFNLLIRLLIILLILNLLNAFTTHFLSTTATRTKNKTLNKNHNHSLSSGRINMSMGKLKLKLNNPQATTITPIPLQGATSVGSQAVAPASPLIPGQPTPQPAQAIQTSVQPINPQPIPECKGTAVPEIKSDISENSQILFTAWVKYLKIVQTPKQEHLKAFDRNQMYVEQLKLFPGADMTKITNDGINNLEEYIKSPVHFYAVLFPNNLNILTSRQV